MGRIEFEVSHQACRFLDPTRGFEPVEKVTEIRRDPLTGRTSHILDMAFAAQRPDVERMVEEARSGFNPFALDKREEVTPRFLDDVEGIPGGRLSVGEALVVPNLFPYDRYSAVTVLSDADFVPLDGFSEDLLANAFRADLDYLWRVREAEGEDLRHYSANWNYMPLAGGSLVHPHHQLIASPVPTNYLRDVEEGLERYGGDYFGDLVSAEEGGERWIGREGGIAWISGFAPLGHIDVVGVFEGTASLFDLTDDDVRALARALLKVFGYLHDQNFVSFNFSLYGLEGAEGFTVHCRLSPRFLLANAIVASDVNYFETGHTESQAFFNPEAAASGLRQWFPVTGGRLAVTLLRTILAFMIFVILVHLGLVYSEISEDLNGLTQGIYSLARLLEIPAQVVIGALPFSGEQRETIEANGIYSIGLAAILIYLVLFLLLGVGKEIVLQSVSLAVFETAARGLTRLVALKD